MTHLDAFQPRKVNALPLLSHGGWRLKRYAIMAEGRARNDAVINVAGDAVWSRMPKAGPINEARGNHGVGVQLIHFAQTAVVVPTFY